MTMKTVMIGACALFALFGLDAVAAAAQLGQGYEFAGNGKQPGPNQTDAWRPVADFRFEKLTPNEELPQGANANLKAVQRYQKGSVLTCGNLKVSAERFQKTARLIAEAVKNGRGLAELGLRAYRSRGEDNQGNLHFTGYFTPRLGVSRKRDERFRFPLYAMPAFASGTRPTRKEIDLDNALASQGLELAWSDDLLDVYFLHVQGSGQLQYADGTLERVAYAGSNGHPYKSLGKYLVQRGSIPAESISLRAIRNWFIQHPEELVPLLHLNPSFTFFKKSTQEARGAADVDLATHCSVAGDTAFFPLGSCLLAEVPRLDGNGRLAGYDLRLLFVHDIGGAIKGSGHLDLYHGVGREAGERAGDLHHYGRVWLLLAD